MAEHGIVCCMQGHAHGNLMVMAKAVNEVALQQRSTPLPLRSRAEDAVDRPAQIRPRSPRTPGTPRPSESGRASDRTSPRPSPRPSREVRRGQDSELSQCIDALYRHRKETLRFLRRCEDSRDLKLLRAALDPQPLRQEGTSRSRAPVRAVHATQKLVRECEATPLSAPDYVWSPETLGSVAARGWQCLAAPDAAHSPWLATLARTAMLPPDTSLTPRRTVRKLA
ncbi:unnamed protein product [Symbiodinium microadriaticum]|nr:unnamed protein product [Symbiodinium microadriaticum]